jgi:hypothetical protein
MITHKSLRWKGVFQCSIWLDTCVFYVICISRCVAGNLRYRITWRISVPSVSFRIRKVDCVLIQSCTCKSEQCLKPCCNLVYDEPCENPVDKTGFELRAKKWRHVTQREGHSAVPTSQCQFFLTEHTEDRLCGLVVRVLDYRSRGPRFDSRALQKKSSWSGTGSTQPREYNWGATW